MRIYPWSIFKEIVFLSVCNVKDGCSNTNWHPVELWSLLIELRSICRECRSLRTRPASSTPRPSGPAPTRTSTSTRTRRATTARRWALGTATLTGGHLSSAGQEPGIPPHQRHPEQNITVSPDHSRGRTYNFISLILTANGECYRVWEWLFNLHS